MLETIIKKRIKEDKYIGFDEFMNLALYHPTYGYYRSNAPIFGRTGDFITSPEVSDLFGFSIAKQIMDIGEDILEFGAGSGVLAAQILCYLDMHNALPSKYYILELSATLKEKQKKNILTVVPHLEERIIWLGSLPHEFYGTILANEVLDAMPTKRGIIKDKKLYELCVGLNEYEFVYQATDNLLTDKTFELIDGYTSEYNIQNKQWLKSVSEISGAFVMLLIDYGYTQQQFFHPQRTSGTLRCYKNHTADENPFIDIGNKDITSWVNFSALSKEASLLGLEILGFSTQAMCLISLGIQDCLQDINGEERLKMLDEIKQLIMPEHMGESFKILALSKNKKIKLRCFDMQDLRHSL